jgi:hypothetical protein
MATNMGEPIARQFHETYERLAPAHGYETREASAKPWEQVPESNRQLMAAVVGELLDRGVISSPPGIEVDGKSLGQLAFEAYRAEVVTAWDGSPIPEWDKLDNGAPARRGWEAAAAEVARWTRAQAILEKADAGPYTARGRVTRWRPVDEYTRSLKDVSLPEADVPHVRAADLPSHLTEARVPVDVQLDDSSD